MSESWDSRGFDFSYAPSLGCHRVLTGMAADVHAGHSPPRACSCVVLGLSVDPLFLPACSGRAGCARPSLLEEVPLADSTKPCLLLKVCAQEPGGAEWLFCGPGSRGIMGGIVAAAACLLTCGSCQRQALSLG